MRAINLMLLASLTAAATGCDEASSDPDTSRPVTIEDVRKNGLPQVAKVTSALVGPTCRRDELQAAARGQDILTRALANAINAYAADTNSALAVSVFGARNQDQTLTVFYNLLWAYQTLTADGQSSNIEYNCNSSNRCGPDDIANSPTPNLTIVCNPDDPYFWQAVPYVMAHEMFHWLGWSDPWGGTCGGDCPDDVHLFAQTDVDIAIQMPEAYALYISEFIRPLFTEPIFN